MYCTWYSGSIIPINRLVLEQNLRIYIFLDIHLNSKHIVHIEIKIKEDDPQPPAEPQKLHNCIPSRNPLEGLILVYTDVASDLNCLRCVQCPRLRLWLSFNIEKGDMHKCHDCEWIRTLDICLYRTSRDFDMALGFL